jgi:hypothetical protein
VKKEMNTDIYGLPRPAVSRYKEIGHVFSAVGTDETLISKPSNGKLGIVFVLAEVPSGLTSPTVTLKDGLKRIGKWSVPSGDAKTLIVSTIGLEIEGDLTAQVNDTGITVSAWAVKA